MAVYRHDWLANADSDNIQLKQVHMSRQTTHLLTFTRKARKRSKDEQTRQTLQTSDHAKVSKASGEEQDSITLPIPKGIPPRVPSTTPLVDAKLTLGK